MAAFHPVLTWGCVSPQFASTRTRLDHSIIVPVVDDDGNHRFSVLAKAHVADCGNALPTTYMGRRATSTPRARPSSRRRKLGELSARNGHCAALPNAHSRARPMVGRLSRGPWRGGGGIDVRLREGWVVGIPRHPMSCSVATTNLADRLVNAVQRRSVRWARGSAWLTRLEAACRRPAVWFLASIRALMARHSSTWSSLGQGGPRHAGNRRLADNRLHGQCGNAFLRQHRAR